MNGFVTILYSVYRRRLTVVIALILSLLLASTHLTYRFDKTWSDLNLTGVAAPIGADYVIIEIDEKDFQTYGGPPLPRPVIAQLLQHIAAANPKRVLMDFAFVSTLDSEGDATLQEAFQQFAKHQLAISAGISDTRASLPKLAEYATFTESRLRADRDGRLRSIQLAHGGSHTNPAYWLSTGAEAFRDIPMDIRLDPASIQRLNVETALATPGPFFAHKRLVIAIEPNLSYTQITLPFHGVVGRGAAFVMAAYAYDQGYAARVGISRILNALCILLFCVGGLATGFWVNAFRALIICGFISTTASFSIAVAIIGVLGTATTPALWGGIFWSSVLVALSARFRILDVLGAFLKGDLSPEEAWLWSSAFDRADPVLLIDGSGQIKRENEAAKRLQLSPSCLVNAVMPRLGQRQNQIEIVTALHSRPLNFEVEWPHPSILLLSLKDISQQKREEAKLRSALRTDLLTQALNRHGFEEALNLTATAHPMGYAVFYIDMNGFKAVNDSYGHDVGDSLLKTAAHRFMSVIGEGDQLARLGGDEFAVLVTQKLGEGQAQIYAKKLEQALQAPIIIDAINISVGAAVGFGLPRAENDLPDAVLKRADQAMYTRKRALKAAIAAHTNQAA